MNLQPAKEPSRPNGQGLPDAPVTVPPMAPPSVAKLILYPPDAECVEIALNQDVVSLGRDPGNRIVISSSYISSFHARFQRQPEMDSFELTDLGSNNGTRVNGRRVEQKVLCHGDMIQFGPALIARFETGAAPAKPRDKGSAATQMLSGAPGKTAAMASEPPTATEGETGSHGHPELHDNGASLLAAQRAELEQLKIEARKRRNDLRAGEAQLKEVRTERDTLLVAVAQATDEHAKAKAAALAQDGAVRTARETLAELESGIRLLQETRARDEAALGKLQAGIKEETAREEAMQLRTAGGRREQESLEDGIRQRREEQASLTRAIANRRDELEEFERTLAALPVEQDTLKTLQAEQAKIRQSIGSSREELQAVETGLERSRREEAQLGRHLGGLRSELSTLEDALGAQRGTEPVLQAALLGLRDELAAGKAEHAALEASAASLTAAIESKTEILAGLDRAIEQQRGEAEAGDCRREALNLGLQTAASLLDTRRAEQEEAALTAAGMRQEAAALREELHVLSEQRRAVRTESEAGNIALAKQEEQLIRTRAEVTTALAELAVGRRDLADLKETLAAAGDDPKSVVEALEQQRLTKAALEQELNQARADLKAIQKDALIQNEELGSTRQKLQEAAAQLQASGGQQQLIDDRMARARGELAALKAEGARLAEEQEAFHEHAVRKAALEEEVFQLESRAAELKTANARMEALQAELAGFRQQIASAENRLRQLHTLIRETETAAQSRHEERAAEHAAHEARLREWESRLVEQEKQAAADAAARAQAAALSQTQAPAAPAPVSLFGEKETPVSPAAPQEELLSLEEELVRMGFQFQPLKKHTKS